ncbi:MAG: hypothetical protein ACC683_10395, partial [Acidimicrobiia bacterium]
ANGLIAAACTSTPVGSPLIETTADGRYESYGEPLTRRSDNPDAGIDAVNGTDLELHTGDFRISFTDGTLLVTRPSQSVGLAMQPLGSELNLLASVDTLEPFDNGDRVGVVLSGTSDWAEITAELSVYPYNPGLVHYRLAVTPYGDPLYGSILPEWGFVDPLTIEPTTGEYRSYAARAPGAAPSMFGYSEALDSTLLYWVDLTALNPYVEATGASTVGTPQRRGQRFGHNITGTDLRRLEPGNPSVLYDSYLYLVPGSPEDENAMFRRYLTQVSDIYDLVLRPRDPLPDWRSIADETFVALSDPDTWIELEGQRYWRAYVADTRQTVEAITQLDVGLAAARYTARYGDQPVAKAIVNDSVSGLANFYNPAFGLIQNQGPLTITGDQGRGDTWYELGHVLKAAEFGALGYSVPADLARRSKDSWVEFAETVGYQFPQFYSFTTWQGTGRQPDAAGGYALYMLRLADMGCGNQCVDQAKAAVRAYGGSGFGFSYETHMTAAAALAAAELADRTGDDTWLEYAYGPIANLIRLSWLHEVDYGPAAEARTFFGLAPTQQAAAITAKEQYEAWIYLTEFLRLAHDRVDPDVEKLVAEFSYNTLVTLASSLPPLLPDGVATEFPSAYSTVGTNRLDLFIPLEDMRDGREPWGAIGQEVYGAGMAPTFAALAYYSPAPGVTIYSGYPPAHMSQDDDAIRIVWTGAPGYRTPVVAWGVTGVTLDGDRIPSEICGDALCFDAESGKTYLMEVA